MFELTRQAVAALHLGLPVAGLPVDVEGEAGGAADGGEADGAGQPGPVAPVQQQKLDKTSHERARH